MEAKMKKIMDHFAEYGYM